jgi:hypothetical protein
LQTASILGLTLAALRQAIEQKWCLRPFFAAQVK